MHASSWTLTPVTPPCYCMTMSIVSIKLLAFIGLALSVYTLYVEYRMSLDPGYQALCDLGAHVSCTKAFSSSFGHIAYLPNAVYGVIFYFAVFWFNSEHYYGLLFPLCCFAALGSVFLAGVLIHLRDFCIVCFSIYIVNFALLAKVYRRASHVKSE
eukprot:TRINITY_DN2125_c0_g1_i2.p1 TRINITY_DN2125_c0_g1~~TRINITY_DN2125_c0_g1_i2.p1  ORF type:complete len:156 (-),score=8.80 TRINITY_DN2125_c0_g1_i2:60-527(-)